MTTHQPLSPEEFNAQLVAALPLVRWYLKGRGFPDDRLDDLVNDTAYRALRYRKTYDPARSKLGTWLCCIALRHSAQSMSRERKLAMLLGKAAASHACRRPGPSEELERREEQERVVALLASLPDDAAAALWLATTGTYEAAMASLSLKEGTLKSTLFRARARVRSRRRSAAGRVAA